MPPVETMEVDSPVAEVEMETTKKDVKDVDTTTTEGIDLSCRTIITKNSNIVGHFD